MRVGSLFTGYGGLDMAVGGELVWYSEIEKAACQVLQSHYPNVPNLGDVKKIDWTQVEPVDVLTGGYPCQPFSHAGLRRGKEDERHLWPYVKDAISVLRPRVAILENVAGHLSLGLRDVLGDLAEVGYDARWGIVRASDAGACHQRKRVFIVAYPAGEGLQRPDAWGAAWHRSDQPAAGDIHAADSDSERHGSGERPRSLEGVGSLNEIGERQTSAAWEIPVSGGNQPASNPEGRTGAESTDSGEGRPSERRKQLGERFGTDSATGNSDSPHDRKVREFSQRGIEPGGACEVDWGKFEPAIRRWEAALGRSAPNPAVLGGPNNRPRLNPQFVEWMMGLPLGRVTGHGLSTAQELKMLGNGVVPQQAILALRMLTGE